MEYNVGDIVYTKKPHPCGNNEWKLISIGVDFKLKCNKCDHIVILERSKAVKAIKSIKK